MLKPDSVVTAGVSDDAAAAELKPCSAAGASAAAAAAPKPVLDTHNGYGGKEPHHLKPKKRFSAAAGAAAAAAADTHDAKATINENGSITLLNGQTFEPTNDDIHILQAIYGCHGHRVSLNQDQVLNLLIKITNPRIRQRGSHIILSAPRVGACTFVANDDLYSNSRWNMTRGFLDNFGFSRQLVEQLQ